MLFHALPFALFLASVLAGSWLLARWHGARTWFLLAASLAFYATWSPAHVLLLLLLATTTWGVGRALARAQQPRVRRAWLVLGVLQGVGMLGFYKYGRGLLQPVGLSFITFQSISYVVDVYRGTLPARGAWREVALYLSFFPNVVAGPIARAGELLPQFDAPPRLSSEEGARALYRIAVGVVKKRVIADLLAANLVDRVFATPANHSGPEVVLGVVGYTLQLYYDFSAYSDVAIGCAALLGVRTRENFDLPYRAADLFDFWRRWHSSLGRWLRDYVYRPLGGSRVGGVRAVLNLWVTLLLGGLWHGAHVKFIAWSAVHAAAMTVQRWMGWPREGAARPARLLGWALTFTVVIQSRILFRAADLGAAWEVFRRQWHLGGASPHLTPLVWGLLAAAFAGHFAPRSWGELPATRFAAWPVPARVAALVAAVLGVKALAGLEPQPFIYFQF